MAVWPVSCGQCNACLFILHLPTSATKAEQGVSLHVLHVVPAPIYAAASVASAVVFPYFYRHEDMTAVICQCIPTTPAQHHTSHGNLRFSPMRMRDDEGLVAAAPDDHVLPAVIPCAACCDWLVGCLQARDTQTASTARVWMKSAIVEREAGDAAAQRALLEEGIKRFPSFWKMWLMLGQLEEQQGRVEAARVAYAAGLKRCADCIPLWRAAAKLEEAQGSVGRARALLEQVCCCRDL
jgi:hypothetical protein